VEVREPLARQQPPQADSDSATSNQAREPLWVWTPAVELPPASRLERQPLVQAWERWEGLVAIRLAQLSLASPCSGPQARVQPQMLAREVMRREQAPKSVQLPFRHLNSLTQPQPLPAR